MAAPVLAGTGIIQSGAAGVTVSGDAATLGALYILVVEQFEDCDDGAANGTVTVDGDQLHIS